MAQWKFVRRYTWKIELFLHAVEPDEPVRVGWNPVGTFTGTWLGFQLLYIQIRKGAPERPPEWGPMRFTREDGKVYEVEENKPLPPGP